MSNATAVVKFALGAQKVDQLWGKTVDGVTLRKVPDSDQERVDAHEYDLVLLEAGVWPDHHGSVKLYGSVMCLRSSQPGTTEQPTHVGDHDYPYGYETALEFLETVGDVCILGYHPPSGRR